MVFDSQRKYWDNLANCLSPTANFSMPVIVIRGAAATPNMAEQESKWFNSVENIS